MRSLRTGQPYRDVVMGVQKPDGSQTWISINSQPLIRPGARSPHAVVATFTDITARKQTESQRELLLAEFEHALLRRGLLLRAVLDLARETSPDDVLLGVLHAAMHLVKGEQGGVTRWDEERQRLVTVASTIPGIEPGFTCGLGQGVTGQAAAQRRPVIFNAYQQEAEVTNPARSAGIMAAVAVPLLYDGKLIGAFGITTSATDQRFAADDAEDLQLLAAIAAAVLVGVERAQLQAIAAAARELAHLVNNDLALAVGTLDILREHDHVGADYQPMVEGALEQLQMAAQRLRQLGRITRFRTWESPAGPSLDLDASAE